MLSKQCSPNPPARNRRPVIIITCSEEHNYTGVTVPDLMKSQDSNPAKRGPARFH